jgi:Tfp pilus assembly protein PilF
MSTDDLSTNGLSANDPQSIHQRSSIAEQSGDMAGARAIMADGLAAHPTDAALTNSAGSQALRAGDVSGAIELFERAAALAPEALEFAINWAIAVGRAGQHFEAAALLTEREDQAQKLSPEPEARYWSVRANAERSARMLSEASHSYERCLALNPRHAKALHGRARIALERAEDTAAARFDSALAVNAGDPDIWLGKAQSLDAAGDHNGARGIMEQIVEQAPGWLEGLKFLAQLRLGAGEKDFTSHYAEAGEKHSADPNIPAAHAEVLAGLDYASEAADVAAKAQASASNPQHQSYFAFLEAVHSGADGQWDRAEAIFKTLEFAGPDRALQEARHRLRARDIARTHALLDEALVADPWSINAWALRGIAWRLGDDDASRAKSAWLHEQAGLVAQTDLCGASDLISRAKGHLRKLHEGVPMPLGQSLRGGTQTRGILFDRPDPLLQELHKAILETLELYRNELPQADETHPLLRHRDRPLELAGSWSVRLTGDGLAGSGSGDYHTARGSGDYHTAHIHPQGLVSSALYLVAPNDSEDDAQTGDHRGWLEIGRPPPDLGLDLPPLTMIAPMPGTLALFPSTLYHGTRPFGDAERMTVAFDAVPVARRSA